MSQTYDVVVVGAGVTGLSTAYHLKRLSPDLSVLVVDKFSACGQGNTSKSAAKIRDTLASNVGRKLAQTSIEFYKETQAEQDIGLNLMGYLWIISEEQRHENQDAIRHMQANGVRLKFYNSGELKERLPQLTQIVNGEHQQLLGLPHGVVGMLGLNCGSIEPDLLTRFYETQFKSKGGQVLYGKEVTGFSLHQDDDDDSALDPRFPDNKIYGVKVDGNRIPAKQVVVAVNTWGKVLLEERLGVKSHIFPKTRQLMPIKSDLFENVRGFAGEGNGDKGFPFTILPYQGIYLYRQGPETLMVGCADQVGRPIRFEEQPVGEPSFFETKVMPAVSGYFPELEAAPRLRPDAGQYDYSADGEPNVFWALENLLVVNGLSGKGIMKADSVGRIAASGLIGLSEAVLHGGEKFAVSHLDINPRDRRVDPDIFNL